MSGADEVRRKRLRLRAWRRGTREMDLILGPYADTRLGELDAARMDAFEALLAEADGDLYAWITGRAPAPEEHAVLIRELAGRPDEGTPSRDGGA